MGIETLTAEQETAEFNGRRAEALKQAKKALGRGQTAWAQYYLGRASQILALQAQCAQFRLQSFEYANRRSDLSFL